MTKHSSPVDALQPTAFSPAYRMYALSVMASVYGLNLVDRGLIMLLLEPIKRDLSLSDTQLGFVTGIAFALFYATLGLPIARWADRGNRATITSLAIGMWGITVMACVLVTNYTHLVAARIAAAIGEAGCKPPTYSLVGDYYPEPTERTRAMSIYWLGGPLAALVSFVIGGWLNELYGWRATFFIMGIPGLILAIIVKLTIREPRRLHTIDEQGPAPSMRSVLGLLWRQRSARHLSIGLILLYSLSFGMAPWYAAFMVRIHHLGTAELGLWFGLIFGFGQLAGILAGGYVANRWFAANEKGQMIASAIAVCSLAPFFVLFLFLPGKYMALATLIPLMAVFSFFTAPTYALLQRLVPETMRATVLSVVMLLANLIGMGAGPQIVGIVSDLLAPSLGVDSLRYAMLMMSFVAILAASHFWRLSRTVQADLAVAEKSHAEAARA